MHSISDLTTTCRRTAGHVPPRLVVSTAAHRASRSAPELTSNSGRLHDRGWVEDVPLREHLHALSYSQLNTPQGGRLVAERTMISALHIFDLKTYYWEEPTRPPPEEEQPPARYFHSADQCESLVCVCFWSTYVFQGATP
jgi:hypothetical protein